MSALLVLAHAVSLLPAPPALPQRLPDRLTIEWLVPERPPVPGVKRIPLRKLVEFGPGDTLDRIVTRLREVGFFEISPDDIAAACSATMTQRRWSIKVHDGEEWRELIVPQDCEPASPELAAGLGALRAAAMDVMTHRLR